MKPYLAPLLVFLVVEMIRKWSLEEEEWIEMVKREAMENTTGGSNIRKVFKKGMSLPLKKLTESRLTAGKGFGKKNSPEKKVRSKQRSWWKKKIGLRRKNFGRLDEWDTQPGMKKVSNFCRPRRNKGLLYKHPCYPGFIASPSPKR